ncbi:MAG: carboxypeptidase-like regulatory domain-containing protein [Thermoguttaceae bacterium]
MKKLNIFTLLAICVVFSSSILGCNKGPALIPVSGKVTLNGEPLEGANVSFSPKHIGNGDAAVGVTDANGLYKLQIMDPKAKVGGGTTKGEYTVTIRKSLVEWDGKSYVQGMGNSEPARATTVRELMPQIYTSDATTPFSAVVEKGKKNYDFDVVSE